MVTIRTGDDELKIRSKSDIDERWINQQINRRRRDGFQVCVRVTIDQEEAHVALITPSCPSGSRLNPKEEAVLDLWKKDHLNTEDFTSGNLIAFLKHLDILH